MIRKQTACPWSLIALVFVAVLCFGPAAASQTVGPDVPYVRSRAGDVSGRYANGIVSRHRRRDGLAPDQDPLFLTPAYYTAGGIGTGLPAVGDVNGDGKLDVVVPFGVSNSASGFVAVLQGNGDGTFQPATAYPAGGSSGPVKIADVNRDGKPDILVANECVAGETECGTSDAANGQLGVLLSNGDGTFQPVVLYDSGAEDPDAMAVADVNGDGKLDVILVNWDHRNNGDNRISVLLGNGNGSFQPAVNYSSGADGFETFGVAVADINGDGKLDLVIANSNGDVGQGDGQVSVLLGNGDGTFQTPVLYDAGGRATTGVVLADVNGDGKLDALVSNYFGTVGVLAGVGNGTFQPVVLYSSGGTGTQSIAVADVSGDGKLDAIVGNANDAVDVLVGNGDGSFASPVPIALAGPTYWVTVADLNKDGGPDVLVGTAVNQVGEVAVLMDNTRPSTTTTLTSTQNPSVFGQTLSFTASVSSAAGTPTGDVTFLDGSTSLGSATLVNGTVSLPSPVLAAGTHSITASYQGTAKFNPSNSAPLNQNITIASTTTSLVATPVPTHVNQRVTYTATVAGQYGGAVTGRVVFMDGSVIIGKVTLMGNTASFTTKYKTSGVHGITATYSGDANNTTSNASVTIYVMSVTKTVVSTSGSPSQAGQSVTFTATVTAQFGAIPNGEQVRFSDGSKSLGSVSLVNGMATLTTSSLSVKQHTIKASYAGDLIFKPSKGSVIQLVEP